jgi:hypothetical protein
MVNEGSGEGGRTHRHKGPKSVVGEEGDVQREAEACTG